MRILFLRSGGGRKAHDHSKPLTIAYVGRLSQWQKRIFDLKELARRLAERDGRYRFLIAGDGYCMTELKSFFENNRFQNVSVDFLGLVDHAKINEVWAESDVNVLFSDHEGMSISMLEGMGQGCVPVVTKVSGTRETVVNDKTGFIISIGDMKAMAGALNRLNADRKMLEAMSDACIEHIRAKHSFEQYDQAFIELLGQAWSSKPSRWPAEKSVVPVKPKPAGSPAPMYRRFHQRVLLKIGRIFRGLFKRK